MFTKEGRTRYMNHLYGVWNVAHLTWQDSTLYIVREDQAEGDGLTWSTASSWAKTSLGTAGGSHPFTNVAADVAGVPSLVGNEITYTNSSGTSQTVYGWLTVLTDGTGYFLLNYKRFATPVTVPNGGTFKFTPGYDSTSP